MFWVLFLLVAWGAAAFSCIRLCLVAARTGLLPDASDDAARDLGAGHELTLYETAFLAGGPHRVIDLALVTMHLRRRLLLAHTGWATVVDPEGRDEMERTVIRAIGPQGQSPIPPVRAAAAAADSVRALADRLVAAGLARPVGAGSDVAAAVRGVRGAALLVVAMAAVVLLVPGQDHGPGGPVVSLLAWFGLPLALTLGCLAIARLEVHPYSSWASPAGQRLLAANEVPPGAADHDVLSALAVRGVSAVDDPALRSALGGGNGGGGPAGHDR
ncbi:MULTISPECIES: TIGR04222 domain-containing membrane protein [unclassified Streptomyces]|uniref:TIGR04222 domain-containing membrane protein n=1 Tax=unclassified Streptomyces TaxID=2593676 RepID=UPI0011E6166D|nr:TIGR04222 domain-containing membrane protein [Streptomyces sp. sk2.1]TXS67885.1 TIGR04222 domain-containing membrane protein [Streptomyces sp. sk2.1]